MIGGLLKIFCVVVDRCVAPEDAKCWPCVHPYGTGSLLSEQGSGGTQRLARNRLMLVQSWFRRNAEWGFWMLNRVLG